MVDIILSSFAYVKGRSLNQGHSQGLEGYLWGGSEVLKRTISSSKTDKCRFQETFGVYLGGWEDSAKTSLLL